MVLLYSEAHNLGEKAHLKEQAKHFIMYARFAHLHSPTFYHVYYPSNIVSHWQQHLYETCKNNMTVP